MHWQEIKQLSKPQKLFRSEIDDRKFNLDKPVVIADAGLLSNENVKASKANGYEYILGARLMNESERIKTATFQTTFTDGSTISIIKQTVRGL